MGNDRLSWYTFPYRLYLERQMVKRNQHWFSDMNYTYVRWLGSHWLRASNKIFELSFRNTFIIIWLFSFGFWKAVNARQRFLCQYGRNIYINRWKGKNHWKCWLYKLPVFLLNECIWNSIIYELKDFLDDRRSKCIIFHIF